MKKMKMRYIAPPMPIDLHLKQNAAGLTFHAPDAGIYPTAQDQDGGSHPLGRQRAGTFDDGSVDVSAVAAMFEH